MPVEFLGIGATNDGSETRPRSGASFDKDFTIRLAAAHEDNGWDRILTAYGSGTPDPAQAAAYIAAKQIHAEFPATFEWPTFFGAIRTLGWMVIVLLLADSLLGTRRRPEGATSVDDADETVVTAR